MGNQVCHKLLISDTELTSLAHTVIKTMDKGDDYGKLLDKQVFKSSYDKLLNTNKFIWFPSESKPINCLFSTELKQCTWNKEEFWCGEHDHNTAPHGKIIILQHGRSIELAHCIHGNRQGKALVMVFNGDCGEQVYENDELKKRQDN